MNWISSEHKKLYAKAMGALYEDAKTASGAVLDTTGNIILTGYQKIKEGADYLDKKYHDVPTEDAPNDTNNKPNIIIEEINDTDESYIDNSDDTDEYVFRMGKTYPDVLIGLNSENAIKRIWVIDCDNSKKVVKGKISSYPYVSDIIHKWFVYEQKNTKWKWYSTNDLYTSFRDSTPGKLNPLDKIVFRYGRNSYHPYPYHPLF